VGYLVGYSGQLCFRLTKLRIKVGLVGVRTALRRGDRVLHDRPIRQIVFVFMTDGMVFNTAGGISAGRQDVEAPRRVSARDVHRSQYDIKDSRVQVGGGHVVSNNEPIGLLSKSGRNVYLVGLAR
jgi:hypothetical protein